MISHTNFFFRFIYQPRVWVVNLQNKAEKAPTMKPTSKPPKTTKKKLKKANTYCVVSTGSLDWLNATYGIK